MRGFEYLLYRAFSLCLLVILVLLPLAPLFASEAVLEESPSSETQSTDTPAEETASGENSNPEPEVDQQEPADVTEEPVPEPEQISVDESAPTDVAIETVNVTDIEITQDEGDSNFDGVNTETLPFAVTEIISEDIEVETESEVAIDEVSDNQPTEEQIELQEEPIETSVTEEVIDIENDSPSTTSAEKNDEDDTEGGVVTVVQGETVSANSVTTDENRFSFAKGECTLVSDETFYCAKATLNPVVTHTDRVFSAVDAEGDKEIYIEKDGEITVISENTFDDEAPYYDASSDTIVWHRLIDGRYQIVTYDLNSEEETQITHDRYNNMHPSSFDGKIVWQGWVGDDWEIFLLEGDELTMITDNATHDITPSVNGTHIIWQSFETGVWQMKVYDIRTKEVHTIEDTNGGSIQNPRFVLVYDTKFESGDVETKGYDLVSGKIVPLSATPSSVPKEIPDPDQTGEKSALVAPQTQLKTKVEEVDEPESSGGDGGTTPDISPTDIVVPVFVSTTTDSEVVPGVPVDADFVPEDVIILPIVSESVSSTEHIDDLIITSYTEPIESEEDIVSKTQ